MEHTIRIDSNAHLILNRIKSMMQDKGHGKPNYSEAIRYLDRLRSEPQ